MSPEDRFALKARAVLAAAARDLPDVVVADDPAGVRLTAPGLRARAFGSRRQERDPRLAAFLGRGR